MYIALAQGIVSPVAYLPSEAIAEGYRVVVELSRGWIGEGIPFYRAGRWEMAQRIILPADSMILYVEGAVGRFSVYQDRRLLWRGETPTAWIPLIGRQRVQLRLTGENGGITGGIYLLAKADTQVWQRDRYPAPLPTCDKQTFSLSPEQALRAAPIAQQSASCVGYPFFPPARVQVALQSRRHRVSLLSFSDARKSSIYWRQLSRHAFVLLWVSIAALSVFFPALRTAVWTGWWQPVPTGLLEAIFGGIWLCSGMLIFFPVNEGFSLFGLFLLYLFLEGMVLERLLGIGQWAWQSWLLPMGAMLTVGFLLPSYFLYALFAGWVWRALRFILYFPELAYLCAAEVFLAILLLSA